MTSEAVDDSVCRDGELDGCLKARDDSLRNKEYVQAFSYMRRLCEDFKTLMLVYRPIQHTMQFSLIPKRTEV